MELVGYLASGICFLIHFWLEDVLVYIFSAGSLKFESKNLVKIQVQKHLPILF
jgi:hypothetical protein